MQRTFIIGDKWLYYKIYSGQKTADMILADVIYPVSKRLISEQLIDSWFFIRYNDKQNHIRWRLHLKEKSSIGEIVKIIFHACNLHLENGHIYRVQIDTYKREIERYGKNSIELSENLFWHDSNMIVSALSLFESYEDDKTCWLFSIRAIDQLLMDFKFVTQQKYDLLNNLANNFGKEFNINSPLIIQLSNKYRKEKKTIFAIMNRSKDSHSPYKPLFELLRVKSKNTTDIVTDILILDKNNKLQIPLNNLLDSYIHMLMNRLFRSKQRLHEMVIYGFLFRYYRTELAREKYNN